MLERFALKEAGNAESGRKLFYEDLRTRCSTCHRANDGGKIVGGNVGPDLSKIGGKFDRPHLIESLLEPSKQIVEGYRSSIIVTNDGLIHTGITKSESNEKITRQRRSIDREGRY